MKTLVSLFLLLIVLAVSGCSSVPVEETYPAELVPGEYQNAASIIFLEKAGITEGVLCNNE